ncbi:hypothetical protein PGT21_004367 [Puccinia graminis f. sp. tritici]|uniref:Ysc84 actin-binding domain-containing protein n=1 Tax=Puccinia graminis f. sp. tritici TaxID=56615 RepID=A0A5B0PTF4_PUCGR|nr:hypothetical protein PGT21_004367 [Puccinia graminis f. sp. tritici]
MTTKPRPQSAFQLNHSSSSTTTKTKTKTTTTTTANQASSDEGQDGDLELRRQQTLKTTLSGTAKTSLDWVGDLASLTNRSCFISEEIRLIWLALFTVVAKVRHLGQLDQHQTHREHRNPVSLGPELAVVAGPIGNGVSFESGPEISPVFSYTKSKGIYGGLQLDGNIIEERTDENARFYGRKVKAEQILQGGAVAVPRAASGLIAVIDAAEGKAYDPEDFPPSIDVAPSEESMGVSTIRESRAKAAQDSGIVEMDEEADEEQQEEEETEVREPTKPDASSPRRRTMPPMAFHPASGSPGKATKQEPQPEPDEAVEADKENAPLAALTLVAPLAAPPPPPPRRRGLTVSRPPTEEGSTGPHSPTTLVPSRQDLPHQASQETIHPPPPPPPSSAPDLDSLSISDSVALLSNNSDKPPEPFLLHERSDSSHSITSPPKPSETEPSSSSSLASVPLS